MRCPQTQGCPQARRSATAVTGGRPTHQDRRQIAEGLAEGLTYTEIAARLDRPLSTITREISRNGYQADLATKERARRSRPAPARADASGHSPEAVHDAEERFTAIMINTGPPRMTARVPACLYLTDSGSLTAAELVQRLQISPASISKAIGELEQQELIRRERDPRRRRDRYVIDAGAWFRGWMASARQNTLLADFAHEGAETLGATSPTASRLPDYWEDSYLPFHTPRGRSIERSQVVTNSDDLIVLVGTGEIVHNFPAHVTRYWSMPHIQWLPINDMPSLPYALVWRTEAENDLIRALAQTVRDLDTLAF